MKLFAYEFYKVFGRRGIWVLFLSLWLVNGLLLVQNYKTDDIVPASAYKGLYDSLRGLSETEKLERLRSESREIDIVSSLEMYYADRGTDTGEYERIFAGIDEEERARFLDLLQNGGVLRYSNSTMQEHSLYFNVLSDTERAATYGAYLDDIKSKADTMQNISIFADPDTFAYRNVLKTAADMENVERVELTTDVSNGVNMALAFPGTDLIAVLFLLLVCVRLIFEEREKGLISLIKPTYKGRSTLILAKLPVMVITCLLTVPGLFGINLWLAERMYGLGDLSRPIQSVSGFMGSVLQMSVGRYILLYLLVKFLACCLIGLIICLICVLSKHTVIVYASVTGVFVLSFGLYTLIPVFSPFGAFKTMNIVHFLSVNPLFREYVNINLFGYPVNLIPSAILCGSVFIAALSFACVIRFCGQKDSGIVTFSIAELVSKGKQVYSVRLFSHEWYKTAIANKALLIILAFVLFQIYSYRGFQVYPDANEVYYKAYMQALEGEMTEGKLRFLTTEQERFQTAEQELAALYEKYQAGEMNEWAYQNASNSINSRTMIYKPAFERVLSRAQAILDYEAETGVKLSFVYETGYERLFAHNELEPDTAAALKILIVAILCFISVFSAEYTTQMDCLLRANFKGRKHTVCHKVCISLLLTAPIYVAAFLPDIINIIKYYRLPCLSAPLQSLGMFALSGVQISIVTYLVLLYAIRLLAAILAVLMILALSQLFKNTFYALTVSALVLSGPMAMSLLGIPVLNGMSLLPLLSGNMLLKKGFGGLEDSSMIPTILQFVVPVVIGIASVWFVLLNFSGEGRIRKRRREQK